MDKNAIKKYAVWARRELISRVSQRAAYFEITEAGFGDPAADSVLGRVLSAEEKTQRQALISQIRQKGYQQVMEEVAYTWFNRFIALRFMEVNGYLPSRVRVFTDEANQFKPQILAEAIHMELDGLDMQKVYAFKNANDDDGLFKYLVIVQCNALSSILPGMFQQISDYTELLFPDNLLREGSVLQQMIELIPEEDWKDAVQIIGWLYQYYISEKHDEIVNINKGVVKQEDIPAATQLFTTDWVVRYMVDNSLGRYWIERHAESNLAEKLDFLVKPKDGKLLTVNEPVTPQDLTFFDPCMGSGHILAYAFDVLVGIYREYGYTDREAVAEIIQNNLHGFDIDERCTQLAYFVVMMKARQYDTRFFRRGLSPQVYCPKVDTELKAYGSLLQVDALEEKPKEPKEITLFDMDYVIRLNDWNCRRLLSQKYAIVCTNPPYLNKYNDKLKKFVTENYKDYSGDLFSVFIYRNFGFCNKEGYTAFMTPFVWMFIKTYETVRKYIIKKKSIITLVQMEYSAYEEATVPICSFVLQNTSTNRVGTYIKLSEFRGGMDVQRQKTLEAINSNNCAYKYDTDLSNFQRINGHPIAFWLSQSMVKSFAKEKPLKEIAQPKVGIQTGDNNRFLRFWFEVDNRKISYHGRSKEHKWFPMNKGGEYRRWYGNQEYVVNWENDGFELRNYKDESGKLRSRPQNLDYMFHPSISWSMITSGDFSVRYFPESFTANVAGICCYPRDDQRMYLLALLNTILVAALTKALNPTLNLNAGDVEKIPVVFNKEDMISSLAIECVSISKDDWDSFETSWDFQIHPLGQRCHAVPNDRSHEQAYLEEVYLNWKNECETRFNQLKANEEELNRIFIDIYGLQDELDPVVADKDVTVHYLVDTKDDIPESLQGSNYVLTRRDVIVSLISYAVGCMFGRYSLDVEGLAYAGGDWDAVYRMQQEIYTVEGKEVHLADGRVLTVKPTGYNQIKTDDGWQNLSYPVDADNVIPICDDEYFDDDMVGRFVKFIETVYGSDTLEENLKFIADALGGKGTPRDVIRSYFLNDFYADHCKTYQKRPIYWLFDSGKKNGFKALIYMHRYQPDTIARIRTAYVHEQQSRYRTAIEDLESRIAAASTAERVKLNKQLKKLQEQDAELRTYEEKIHHLADQMISIDLDDGVKVNYAKFQDVLAKIK